MFCRVQDAIAFDGSARERTNEGFLRANAVIARVGVQLYRRRELGLDGDGVVRMYRPAEEVFAPAAVASVEDKAVTDNHPREDVTPANWQRLARGHVRDAVPRPQDGLLGARVTVSASDLIKAVDTGKSALSCGYSFTFDNTPGTTPDGQAYDAIMRDIRVNHVAVVDKARGGPACRISDGEKQPMKIKIGDRAFEVEDQDLAAAVASQALDLDKARKAAQDAGESLVKLTTERDDAITARDEALKQVGPEAIRARVLDLAQASEQAKTFGVEVKAQDALTLRREALTSLKDPAHVAARDAFLAGTAIDSLDEDSLRRIVGVLVALAPRVKAGDTAISRALQGHSVVGAGEGVPVTISAEDAERLGF